MLTNYHTHTFRCKHATGNDKEYIEKAIEKGLKILAFTEHMPDKDIGSEYRPDLLETEEYIETFTKLKMEYSIDITILVGLECEYFNDDKDIYKKWKNNEKLDLLILGHHLMPDKTSYYFDRITPNNFKHVLLYKNTIIPAMESGFFDFIAHPDIFLGNYLTWDKYCEETTRAICETSLKLNIPLEVNAGGIREALKRGTDRYFYPRIEFWNFVRNYGNKVIINGDYHSVESIEDKYTEMAREFAKKLKLNIIDKL